MTLKTVISVAILIVALLVSFLIRRWLIRLLKKTVIDNWIIQTLGVIIFLIPVILAVIGTWIIWGEDTLNTLQGISIYKGETLSDLEAEILPKLIGTVILIPLGIGAARTVRSLTLRGLGDNRVDINMRTFIGRSFYFAVLLIVVLLVLSVWQISPTVPVAAISVITVAVSFAVQDILKDLVAGFYLLIERPFYIGDQISISIAPTIIYVGKVQGIELRATKLRLISGEEVTIPNGTLFGNVVINNTYYGERRAALIVKMKLAAYHRKETDNQILTVVKDLDIVMDKPEPAVLFSGYAEDTITLTVRFWVASGQVIDVSDVMFALHTLLPEAELEVKEPSGSV